MDTEHKLKLRDRLLTDAPLTRPEAAEYLGVSPRRFTQLAAVLPSHTGLGPQSTRWYRSELDTWLKVPA